MVKTSRARAPRDNRSRRASAMLTSTRPPDGENRDLGRNAKSNGNDARADSAGHEQVVLPLFDVARRIPLAKLRRHEGAADPGKGDLPAMRVAGHRERDARGDGWEDVRIVSQHHCGSFLRDVRKRT